MECVARLVAVRTIMKINEAMRLSEARVGDQLRLLATRQKRALRWFIYHDISEDVSMEVTSLSRRSIRLSAGERTITVPAWVAQTTWVHPIKKRSGMTKGAE